MVKNIFEISWEVANKVGGIYTVVVSKANYAKKLGDDYYFIGPYLDKYNNDFIEKDLTNDLKKLNEILRNRKITLHYGVWKATNSKAILIDFNELLNEKNSIKTDLWNNFRVDSLFSGFDFDEPTVFGYSVGMFLEEFSKMNKKLEIIAQFHEWLTGSGILYLKEKNPKIKTIFTTHSTVLERAMASNKEVLFPNINPDFEAKKRNVSGKHTLEKQCALNVHVFTTVSEKCGKGCEIVLGRKPDFLTINGLDITSPLSEKELFNSYVQGKEMLKEIVISHFFPYYQFDLENSFFCFISGRCEIYSKGIDVLIKSLGELNQELSKIKNSKTIVAFILIPAKHSCPKEDLLKNLCLIKSLNKNDRNNLFYSPKKFRETCDTPFFKEGSPEISTHFDPEENIIQMLHNEGLNNKKENKVKIIFCPCYLSSTDGFWNKEYYDFIKGFDLGVFPSFYEPWGYTPEECCIYGIPAITTDLAGYGVYARKNHKIKKDSGISVLNREEVKDNKFVDCLKKELLAFSSLSTKRQLNNRINAASFSNQVSWKSLIKNYVKAYNLKAKKK